MKCPVCDLENSIEVKFCVMCGTNLNNIPQKQDEQQKQNIEKEYDPINDVLQQPGLNNSPDSIKPALSKTALLVAITSIVIILITLFLFIFISPSNEVKKEKELTSTNLIQKQYCR